MGDSTWNDVCLDLNVLFPQRNEMVALLIGLLPPHDDLVKQPLPILNHVQWLPGHLLLADPQTGALTRVVQCLVHNNNNNESGNTNHHHNGELDDDDEEEEEEESVVVEKVLSRLQTALEETNARCELWASAPCVVPWPVTLQQQQQDDNDPHHHPQQQQHPYYNARTLSVAEFGVEVVENVLDVQGVQECLQAVHTEIDRIEALLQAHRPQLNLGTSTLLFAEIASRDTQRFDLRLDGCSAVQSVVQAQIVQRPSIVAFLQEHLHEEIANIDYDLSVVYSKPGAKYQGWHADGGFLSSPKKNDCYALCLFVPLIHLDAATGGTQFWPGSHTQAALVGFGPLAELTQCTWDGYCSAGDGIWYDYRLLHRGMPNTKTLRPVLQIVFKQSWYVERNNYGTESVILKKENNNRQQNTTTTRIL